jgi:hypothetical protein
MKYLLLICWVLSASMYTYAQDCTQVSVSQKPGIWKEGMKGSASGILPTDLEKERKVVASLHSMVKSKYNPVGIEADFNGSYDRPDPSVPVNNYSYQIYFMPYYCDKNVMKTAHETSTTLSIASNRVDWNIFELPGESFPEGFFSMKNMPAEKDGNFYFEENASLGFGETGKSRNWIITTNGKLPYAYVTKKEFLEKQKSMLVLAMPKAIESAGESSKARTEKEFKNALSKIETLMKMPAVELSQPAIVRQDPNDYLSYLFTNDDDAFGKVLIKPNPGYFNSKLPRSSPQFLVVNITGSEKDPVASKVTAEVIKSIDFSALKDMLGK